MTYNMSVESWWNVGSHVLNAKSTLHPQGVERLKTPVAPKLDTHISKSTLHPHGAEKLKTPVAPKLDKLIKGQVSTLTKWYTMSG